MEDDMTKKDISRNKPSGELETLRQRVAELEALVGKNHADNQTPLFEDDGIYKAIFESANDSILFVDKKGKIIDFNDRLVEIGGYPREEFLGKNIRSLSRMITGKSMIIILNNFLKRMAGIHVSPYEVELIKKNGELVNAEISARPLRKANRVIGDLVLLRNVTERKQAEKALKESEEKYRLIVENNRDIIFTLNITAELTYVSPSAKNMLGYNPADLIGHSFSTLIHPEDIAIVEEVIQRDIQYGYQTPNGLEFRIRHCSGEWRWYNGKGSVLKDANGKFINFIGIVNDITDRKQVEEALKESETKYRNVVELAKDGICIIQNKMVRYCNPQLAEMWGGNPREIKDTPFTNYLHSDALTTVIERYKRRMAGEPTPSRYETILKHKDGRKIYVEVNIGILNYLGQDAEIAVIHDITERKQAEEAIKESEQNFRNFLDNSSMGIRIRDENEHILYLNQAFLDIFGYESVEEAKSTFPMKHYTPESYKEYLLRSEKISRGEAVPNKVEVDIIRKDGTIRHVQVIGQRVVRNGKVQGRTYYNDITENMQAAEILKTSEQNLHNALDKLPMGFRITDSNDNTLYLNQAFLNIFGYENADEVKRKPPLKDFYTPESYAGYMLRKEKLRQGDPRQDPVEVDIIRKDGTMRHLLLSTAELLWNGKQEFQTIYNDITERVQAEEALKLSEQNFRNSLDNSSIGIRISDKIDQNSYANQALLDIFGYENIEELKSSPPQERYTPESYTDFLRRHEQMLRGEPMPKHVEIDIKRKNSTIRHLDVSMRDVFWDGRQQYQTLYNDITERVQAEEARKLSEQNFRNSLDSSTMGIRIVGDADITLYVNQTLLDIFGYKNIDELKVSPPHQHYTPESYVNWHLRHEKLLRGEPVPAKIDADIVRKDGAIRHLQVSRTEVFWDGERRFQTLYNDVTEQKKIEMALRESEEKYRTIFESANDTILLLDTNGNVVDVNARLTEISGYERDELIGKNITGLNGIINNNNMTILMTNLIKRLTGTPVPTYHLEVTSKVGESIIAEVNAVPINKDGKAVGVLAVLRDITERMKSELLIKEQKALTDRILESTPDAVAVVGQDRQIVMVNKAFEHTFDLTRDNAKAKAIEEIIHVPIFTGTISQVLTSGLSQFQIEFRFKKGTQEKVLVADIISMQKNEVLVHLHDATEERNIQERLYQTDRLASVGEMAAGIAHELNNPLTGVVALSQLLLEGGVPPEIKDDLEAISNEGQRAANVVKNMLSFARSHTLSAEPVEINAIINQVLNLRAYEHRVNNIEVVTHLDPDLPEIIADHFQIQQVFVNIVLNAEQAMIESHGQGILTVITEKIENVIRISFTDDGPGIPPDIINRIFDPFFTTKEVGKGTGLGLSICYGIITKQGGRISVQSQPNNGATFVVELPLNAR
jgi:PAS domain S-box-containing protein